MEKTSPCLQLLGLGIHWHFIPVLLNTVNPIGGFSPFRDKAFT